MLRIFSTFLLTHSLSTSYRVVVPPSSRVPYKVLFASSSSSSSSIPSSMATNANANTRNNANANARNTPLLLGVCGGIASGKSSLATHLLTNSPYPYPYQHQHQYPPNTNTNTTKYIASDALAAYSPNDPLTMSIVSTFDCRAPTPPNTIDTIVDRAKLGSIVFSSLAEMAKLEALVWPSVRSKVNKLIEGYKSDGTTELIVLESAVLLDAGWDEICDHIFVVRVDRSVAIRRMVEDRGMRSEEAVKRVDAQSVRRGILGEVDAKCPFTVIANNGERGEFLTNVDNSIAAVLSAPVPLRSSRGQEMLRGCAPADRRAYDLLWPHFGRQQGRTMCGPASAAMLLRAMGSAADEAGAVWDEVLVLSASATATATEVGAKAKRCGLTMSEMRQLLQGTGLECECEAATVGSSTDEACAPLLASLRGESESESESFVILNYHMTTAGQAPFGGHFSPLAAYHSRSRRFLVLDVWPETEPSWLDADALVAAMRAVDSESGLPRGWLYVSRGAVGRESSNK
mgnify:CR=1 FL=1